MLCLLFALVVTGTVTAFALLLLPGEYANEGAVLVGRGEDRVIHEGDVLVLAGWAAALLSAAGLLVEGRDED